MTLRGALEPLSIEEYPAGTVLRVEDMNPVHRAFAEAEHEDCPEEPPGHPLSAHAPWTGGDLDGVETWESFVARLARHGLTLAIEAEPVGLDDERLAEAIRRYIEALPSTGSGRGASVWVPSIRPDMAAALAREYAQLAGDEPA